MIARESNDVSPHVRAPIFLSPLFSTFGDRRGQMRMRLGKGERGWVRGHQKLLMDEGSASSLWEYIYCQGAPCGSDVAL